MGIDANLNSFINTIERIVTPWVSVSDKLAEIAKQVLSQGAVDYIEKLLVKKEDDQEHPLLKFLAQRVYDLLFENDLQSIRKLCRAVLNNEYDKIAGVE